MAELVLFSPCLPILDDIFGDFLPLHPSLDEVHALGALHAVRVVDHVRDGARAEQLGERGLGEPIVQE